MLTYEQYKAKHEWATQNIDTFEGRLADGRACLEATHGELKIASDKHTTASSIRQMRTTYEGHHASMSDL